ncbi:MAG TPA: DUF6283 family protein [Acidimicrobiia bacterium]|nr:DUF6283 family protein [Acidimicrobiia bacterium]
MGEPLHCAPRPCATCPYAKATPPGIWHPDEYEKLAAYDDDGDEIAIATFHCHQENATGNRTVCKGWVAVHPDSIAVRIALIDGRLTWEQVDADTPVEVYASGAEARDAGLAGVDELSPEAAEAMMKLVRRGAGRWDEDGDG